MSSPAEMTPTATTTVSATAASESTRPTADPLYGPRPRPRGRAPFGESSRPLSHRPGAALLQRSGWTRGRALGGCAYGVPEPGGFEVPCRTRTGGVSVRSPRCCFDARVDCSPRSAARRSRHQHRGASFFERLLREPDLDRGTQVPPRHPRGHALLDLHPGRRASDLRPLGRFVVSLIRDALNSEGLPSNTFGDLVADEVELAKTADRSVLGCMNEMAWFSELVIMDAGNIRLLDVAQLNHELRRLIFGPLGRAHPIELATALAGART